MTELLIIAVVVLIYFAPTISAYTGKSEQISGIFILNLFLGWTILGWIGALVWAFATEADEFKKSRLNESGLKTCPFCAESIKLEAIVCRFCKRELTETK